MSDIAPINTVPGGVYADRIEPVTRPGQKYDTQAPGRVDPATDLTQRPSDRVDISDRARLLAQLSALPDIREDLISQVRDEIAAGSYETDDKLEEAITSLLQDLDPGPIDS
jgi:negative regulator of flagellin synthesis FlgM